MKSVVLLVGFCESGFIDLSNVLLSILMAFVYCSLVCLVASYFNCVWKPPHKQIVQWEGKNIINKSLGLL